MQFFNKTCQFSGANYIREWCQVGHRKSKNGRKNGRAILSERFQDISGP